MVKQPQISFFYAVLVTIMAFALGREAVAAGEAKSARQAYSGSNMTCLVGNDFYAVHFTAIQEGRQKEERTDFTKYCQEIPAIGKTYLSIDLLDRDVRKTPVSLRVIKEEFSEEDGRPPQELGTLTEASAKIYPNGTADIAVDIKQPGHYALIATIGNEAISEDDRLRIPFTVAVEGAAGAAKINWLGRITGFIVLTFFGVMGFIGLRTYRAYRPKRGASVGAEA
jgi:hypothetical protein